MIWDVFWSMYVYKEVLGHPGYAYLLMETEKGGNVVIQPDFSVLCNKCTCLFIDIYVYFY